MKNVFENNINVVYSNVTSSKEAFDLICDFVSQEGSNVVYEDVHTYEEEAYEAAFHWGIAEDGNAYIVFIRLTSFMENDACIARITSIEEAKAVVEAAKKEVGDFYVTASIKKTIRGAFEEDDDPETWSGPVTSRFDFGPFQTKEEAAKAAAFLESDGCEEVAIAKR